MLTFKKTCGIVTRDKGKKWPTADWGVSIAVTIPETTAGRGGGMVESSIKPYFQKEAKCTTFLVKMSFICTRMKNHFHVKGLALNLVLIWKPGGTRKWPIIILLNSTPYLMRHAVASPCEHNFYRVASLCYAVTCPSPTRVYGPLITFSLRC